MTSSIGMWLLALWMIATAGGIAVFWATWFRTPHQEEWLPVGYVEHERVFVYPDSFLSILLVSTAVLTVLDKPAAHELGLLSAGMMTFLGLIDLAYFAQHGMFARERDGLLNAFLVVALLALATTLATVGIAT